MGQAQNFQESKKALILCNLYLTSDGVLNPNGVRFGSAEIYNIGKYYCDLKCVSAQQSCAQGR